MASVISPNTQEKLNLCELPVASRSSNSSRSLSFKYYIHDSVSTLRFQLIGDLQAANLTELKGSWDTARTTLSTRCFLLDLRQLYSADAESRAWLLKMKEIGAQFMPANYLDSSNKTSSWVPEQVDVVKLSILGRVIGLLRS